MSPGFLTYRKNSDPYKLCRWNTQGGQAKKHLSHYYVYETTKFRHQRGNWIHEPGREKEKSSMRIHIWMP